MPLFVVTYTSMAFEAENEDAALEEAMDDSGGGHWEAREVPPADHIQLTEDPERERAALFEVEEAACKLRKAIRRASKLGATTYDLKQYLRNGMLGLTVDPGLDYGLRIASLIREVTK